MIQSIDLVVKVRHLPHKRARTKTHLLKRGLRSNNNKILATFTILNNRMIKNQAL